MTNCCYKSCVETLNRYTKIICVYCCYKMIKLFKHFIYLEILPGLEHVEKLAILDVKVGQSPSNIGVLLCLFIYLGFYIAFNTVHIISRWVVGRAEETSTYSSSGFCTVNCRPTTSNYQLSHLKPCREPNPDLIGGSQECYHSATVAPGGLL